MKGHVKPIPKGYHTLTPYLMVHDAAEAIRFYKKAFGATEMFRMDGPDHKVAHAEIQVIREAARKLGSWRLDGLTIYTTLEPCPMCAEAILQSRISRVVFGAYDQISGALGSAFNLYGGKRLYPIPEVTCGVLEEECAQALKEFFRERK